MKKVIAYIDGFNLYYGMLKGTSYKWLDLERFVDALVADDIEVVAIKYFTAQIKTYPFDLQKIHRQLVASCRIPFRSARTEISSLVPLPGANLPPRSPFPILSLRLAM